MERRFRGGMDREETAGNSHVPVSTSSVGAQFHRNRLRRNSVPWTIRLLSTSVLVTRTPLTTLKSLLKANMARGT